MYTVNHSGAKRKRQLIVLLLVFALILTLSVGTALAFLAMRTNPLENIFQPAEITCAIEENFDGSRKSDVRIRNTGTAPAYIRAEVVVTWVNSGGSVAAEKPAEGIDYEIIFAEDTGWISGTDGYWYHAAAVGPSDPTGVLIRECTQITEKTGCQLVVEILASAVQSEPQEAVADAWGVTVNPDGTISR